MAEKAAGALLDHGVRAEHISILFPEGYCNTQRETTVEGEKLEHAAKSGISTTTMGDATAGSASGAGLGFSAGAIAALAAVFIPGFGLVLGGGALAIAVGAVAGSTVAGAVAGGVTGFLKDQGVPPDEIEKYHAAISTGGAMITVSLTDDDIDMATVESLLSKYGGAITSYPRMPAVGLIELDTPPKIYAAR